MRSRIAPAAMRAAMPLRSVPDDAAVGEVLGTLAVFVAVMRTKSSGNAELLGDDLRDLDEEPLPHLGAAVVQMDRAVVIDMDQRAGLVEMDQREARCRTSPASARCRCFRIGARRVEGGDLLAAARDSRDVRSSVLDQRRQRVGVLDLHAVGRAIARPAP